MAIHQFNYNDQHYELAIYVRPPRFEVYYIGNTQYAGFCPASQIDPYLFANIILYMGSGSELSFQEFLDRGR